MRRSVNPRKFKHDRLLLQFTVCALFTLVNAGVVLAGPEESKPMCFMAMAMCGVATILVGLEIRTDSGSLR